MSKELKDTQLFKNAELRGFLPVVPTLRVRELDVQIGLGASAQAAINAVFIKILDEKIDNCLIAYINTYYDVVNSQHVCQIWYFYNR